MTVRIVARFAASALPFVWAAAATAATLTPIAPYADPAATGQGLLGINNAGYTTGSVSHADGSARGFVRAPDGTYTLFDDTAQAGVFFTQGRAISNTNTVIGFSTNAANTQVGFQRTAAGTASLLRRPSDSLPLAGISQGINDSGAIVGNFRANSGPGTPVRNHGYILSGTTFTELTEAGFPTASVNARGIANDGTVVGWTSDGANGMRGWIYSSGSYAYLRHPLDVDNGAFGTTILEAINNTGQILGGYSQIDAMGNFFGKAFIYNAATHGFTDIVVPGATSVQTFGINDSGQYVVSSDAGQFIYSPDGPSAPDGSSVFLPVSGGVLPPGQAQFAITVAPGTTYYIDPAFATGFEYLSGNGPLFSGVTAPAGIGTGNLLSLYLWNGSAYVFDRALTGGVAFDFTAPVSRFALGSIPGSAAIDPNNPTGFVTGLRFASAGQFNGFQNALGAVPEPASWALMIAGFAMTGRAMRRRAAVA